MTCILPAIRRLAALLVLSAVLASVSCERSTPESSGGSVADRAGGPTELEILESGAAAAKAVMETLGAQLKSAMEAGGPVAAVDVCRQVAAPLTDAVGDGLEGATIRRVTLKPRNPANSPDETDREVLETMAAQSPPGVIVRGVGGTTRYYQPIAVQEVCLKCHGDPSTFPEPLVELLATSYPGDAATGYSAGDLRGAIRVDFAPLE